jgi:hypothetical protein
MIFGRRKTLPKWQEARAWFAWYPVKLHDGRWAWLATVWADPVRVIPAEHTLLNRPKWFFRYSALDDDK